MVATGGRVPWREIADLRRLRQRVHRLMKRLFITGVAMALAAVAYCVILAGAVAIGIVGDDIE